MPTTPTNPSITIDAHMDVPWLMSKVVASGEPVFNCLDGHASSMFTKDKARTGGLNAAIFALYLPDSWQDAMTQVEVQKELTDQFKRLNLDTGVVICSGVDYLKIRCTSYPESKFLPIMIGLEGGRLINEDLGLLEKFADRGIKYLTLTHNRNTTWADSATDAPNHMGLTMFGVSVVKKCNDLGVFVDVSHASDTTAYDVISCSTKPILATHSGCRTLVKQPRNLTDALIRRIAESGGIICVPYAKRFIGHYRVVDHIYHIIDLVGADHVGIGSDLDGAALIPEVKSVADWKSVVYNDLIADGVNHETVDKILGGNLLRVLGS